MWDELRRKVTDAQRQLPPGAGPSLVNDDFGDVYGVYVAITGEGYTLTEIYEYAKFLQRELLQATDVKRIVLYGVQPEVIYVEMRREKMAELGISQQDIYQALASKNLPTPAGYLTIGQEYIPVNPTGEFKSETEFGDLLVRGQGPEAQSLVYLRDVADIRRGYKEPADNYLRYDGKPAIGLAISTVLGGNVLTMGDSLEKRLKALTPLAPLGMDLQVIYQQTEAVKTAINGFLVNLAEAVGIVVLVLLIFMGLRTGLIIGAVLLVTIMGTFIFMNMGNVTLERISLGALVIALGMLVDNAIVVTDGMRMKMDQGTDALTAAREVVGQVGVPLLGATLDRRGRLCRHRHLPGQHRRILPHSFFVILISLALSWVTAVTTTPLLCKTLLKGGSRDPGSGAPRKDPYGGKFYRLYQGLLSTSIRFRWFTVGVVVVLFGMALIGFGTVKKSFFPDSTSPMYYVDLWFPEGTHIDETSRRMQAAEAYLATLGGTRHLISFIGGGQIRFLLTYSPESAYASFGQVIHPGGRLPQDPGPDAPGPKRSRNDSCPQAVVNTRAFVLGPSTGGKIQLRINGPDPVVLRQLAQKAEEILLDDPLSKAVRNEWRTKVKVVRPQMAEAQARRAGIDRPQLAQAIAVGHRGDPGGGLPRTR